MNRRWLISVFFAFLVTAFSVVQAHAVMVGFNVLDDYIEVGESFDVEVWVDGEDIGIDLLWFGFDVVTPDIFFTYTGYTLGDDFMGFSGPDTYVSGMAFPAIPDDVVLATLSFSADAVGTDTLWADGPYDSARYGLSYGFFPNSIGFDIDAITDITVNAAAPIPEPGTLLLLSAGLIGLGLSRKKF